jgi:sodium/bile acid cotransporter 7
MVQLSTFLLFPIIILPFFSFCYRRKRSNHLAGFSVSGALPSTVSSSVVMVSIARGNVPAAIFNASISGLIGIVITPLWMGLFLQQTSADFNLEAFM